MMAGAESDYGLERIPWSCLVPVVPEKPARATGAGSSSSAAGGLEDASSDYLIGDGKFGIVYSAIWYKGIAKRPVRVAVKIFKLSLGGGGPGAKADLYTRIERDLLDEAHLMRRASDDGSNENVVHLYGVSCDFVTTEWIEALDDYAPVVLVKCSGGEEGSILGGGGGGGGGGKKTIGGGKKMLALIMKYEAGGTLEGLLYNPSSPWTANTQERLRVLLEITTGLWHLHNNSGQIIIHGDIKPANVLLSSPPNVIHARLSDFGLSNARERISSVSAASSTRETASDRAAGTWMYTSPEMHRQGEKLAQKASRSTDVYALGTLMWEVLVGERPWADYGEAARLTDIRSGLNLNLDKLPKDTPATIREVIAKCLSMEKNKRPRIDDVRICFEQAHNVMREGEFDIFLSYAWGREPKDWRKPLADQIYISLCNFGFRVWMDELQMGLHLKEGMTQGISKSALVVVLLSPDYIRSGACTHELREVNRLGKPLVVCMVEPGFWRDWKKADGSDEPVLAVGSEFIEFAKLDKQLYADCSAAVGINWSDEDNLTSEQRRLLTHGAKAVPLLKMLVDQALREIPPSDTEGVAGAERGEQRAGDRGTADGGEERGGAGGKRRGGAGGVSGGEAAPTAISSSFSSLYQTETLISTIALDQNVSESTLFELQETMLSSSKTTSRLLLQNFNDKNDITAPLSTLKKIALESPIDGYLQKGDDKGGERDADLRTVCSLEPVLARIEQAQKDQNEAACVAVIDALRTHKAQVGVADEGCSAIANLAFGNEALCAFLGRLDACELVVEVLETHQHCEAVVVNGCVAIAQLAADNTDNKRYLIAAGAVALVTAISTNTKKASARSASRSALAGLSTAMSVEQALASIAKAKNDNNKSACALVVEAFRAQRGEPLVAERACLAIAVIAFGNLENASKLGQVGACEVIVEALRVHKTIADIAWYGCLAIIWLTDDNQANRTRLSAVGACEVLVDTIRSHAANEYVAFNGCGAIKNLTAIGGDLALSAQLGQVGACEAVAAALRAHVSNSQVAMSGLGAIGHLSFSNSENTTKLGQACLLVVDMLRLHKTDDEVARDGSMAIYLLASGNEDNKRALLGAGAVALVTSISICASLSEARYWARNSLSLLTKRGGGSAGEEATTSSSPSTPSMSIEYALDLIIGKAHLDEPTPLYSELLVEALLTHTAYPVVAERGCQEVARLARTPFLSTKLGQLGACEAVAEALKIHGAQEKIALACFLAISNLCDDSAANRSKLGLVGSCEAVVEAIQRHLESSSVAESGCLAISRLAHDTPDNRLVLVCSGAVEAVTAISINCDIDEFARDAARVALESLHLHSSGRDDIGAEEDNDEKVQAEDLAC